MHLDHPRSELTHILSENKMPLKIKFMLETKQPSIDEALKWIRSNSVTFTVKDQTDAAEFQRFLDTSTSVYGFLQAARCVSDYQAFKSKHVGVKEDFWELIKIAQQTTNSAIKYVSVALSGFSYREAGIKYFKAIKTAGDGKWGLEARDEPAEGFAQAVYWLPYVASAVTSVNRADFERNPEVNFFMTLELSGCRFTVTDQAVYHVAFDAGTKPHEKGNSVARSKAEVKTMTECKDERRNTRRLSITGDDESSYGYGYFKDEHCRATVIGVRGSPWVYKAIIYNSQAWRTDVSTPSAFIQILDNTRFANGLWA